MSVQNLTDSHYIFISERNGYAHTTCLSVLKPDGYSSNNYGYFIGKLDGHPCDSIEIVIHSLFSKLDIPAEHKYKLLQPLPRPGMTNPGMVAFYPDDEKRKKQLLTVMKPGRYMRKVLVDELGNCLYSDTQIEKWANQWITEYSKIRFHLLSTGEDIVNAYTMSGISSCMSHDSIHFDSRPYHPCEVYGEDWDDPKDLENRKWIETDTRLAVIYDDDQGQEGFEPNPENIVSRCIVVPDKKIRGPVYGDRHKLEMLLEVAGYRKNSDEFEGTKMRHIMSPNGTVCPYFDFSSGAHVNNNHLIACFNSDGGENQNGLLEHGHMCCMCDVSVHPDDIYTNDNGDNYCENCYYDCYTYCNVLNETVSAEEIRTIHGLVKYDGIALYSASRDGIQILIDEGYVFECEYSGERYSSSSYDAINVEDGCIYESQTFFGRMRGFQCAFTEEYFSENDIAKVEVSPSVFVAHHKQAGYCEDDYRDWLEKNNYHDEEFMTKDLMVEEA